MKARGKQCDAQVQIVFESEHKFSIQFNGKCHSCASMDECTKASKNVSVEIATRIKSLFRSGTRMPKSVQAVLRDDFDRGQLVHETEPSMNQIKYQIQKCKDETFGDGEISLGDLKSFLFALTTKPSNIDKPFVLDFKVKFGENDILNVSTDTTSEEEEEKFEAPEKSSFWFFFTTVRLLENMKKTTLIAADSTFKLVWQGYSGISLGTVDMKKQYHKFGFGISSSEKSSDWAEIFLVNMIFDIFLFCVSSSLFIRQQFVAV